MANDSSEWKVGVHQPIQRLNDHLWRVEGSLPNMAMKRVMTVARRNDGRLVIHSAIALDDGAMKELEAWGEPGFLVVPNAFHRLDAPAYLKRYPGIKVLAPKGSQKKVRDRVRVDGSYEDLDADANVTLTTLRGVKEREGLMSVKSTDGTSVVLNDVVFNMPHLPGAMGWVVKHVMQSSGGPRVTRIARLALISSQTEFRDDLRKLAEIPDLRRVVVSHHETIDQAPGDVLRAIATA